MRTHFKKVLLFIVFLGLIVRLYDINTPLADWHSFRQADTVSVTREYIKHGIDLLHPKYQDLSNIQSGVRVNGADNVLGLRMVEFPLVNGFLAWLIRLEPHLDLVIVSRLFSIVVSLGALVAIAFTGKWLFSEKVGLLSALFFALNPYTVYYSRTTLPEPFLVFCIAASIALFTRYQRNRQWTILLGSAIFFSAALLTKPMAIFYAPLFVGIAFATNGWKGILDPVAGVLFAGSAVPLLMWRQWIAQYPVGIPASDWLFNGNGIRLRPAWFRWLFWERLTKLILGYTGILFFSGGLFASTHNCYNNYKGYTKKPETALVLGGIGALAYLVVFATGNVQHDYYQYILMPYLALLIGYGINWLVELRIKFIKIIIVIAIILSEFFGWKQVAGYYHINNWAIVHAGVAADKILPPDAKVIAPYQGDTAFLFQINRTGWPIGFDIDKKVAEGAGYYVSVNYDDEARALEKRYATVAKTSEYIILDLTKKL